MTVEELGRFHGQLYALKYADTARFDSIKTRLIESRYFDRGTNKEWDLYLKLGVKRALQSARKSTETIVPDAFLQRLQHVLADPFAYQRKCVQPSEPMAVVCHGDFLRSNIAFRYDDNGKATDAMLFDFQTLRYASPMIDLCTFMANSTWQEVRNKYFAEIFGAYHRTLTKHLLVTANWTESDIPDHLKYVRMQSLIFISFVNFLFIIIFQCLQSDMITSCGNTRCSCHSDYRFQPASCQCCTRRNAYTITLTRPLTI